MVKVMFCQGEFNAEICGRNFKEVGWLAIGRVRVFRNVFGVWWCWISDMLKQEYIHEQIMK